MKPREFAGNSPSTWTRNGETSKSTPSSHNGWYMNWGQAKVAATEAAEAPVKLFVGGADRPAVAGGDVVGVVQTELSLGQTANTLDRVPGTMVGLAPV